MSLKLTRKTIRPWKCLDININDVFAEDEELPSIRRFLIKDIPPCPNGFVPTDTDMVCTVLMHSPETLSFFKNNQSEIKKIFPSDFYLERLLKKDSMDGEFDILLKDFIKTNVDKDSFKIELRRLMIRLWD